MAEKAVWLNKHFGGNQYFGMEFGPDHIAMEDDLRRKSEVRIAYLRRMKPLWTRTVRPETMYTIQQFNARGGQWKTAERFEVPQLRELVG